MGLSFGSRHNFIITATFKGLKYQSNLTILHDFAIRQIDSLMGIETTDFYDSRTDNWRSPPTPRQYGWGLPAKYLPKNPVIRLLISSLSYPSPSTLLVFGGDPFKGGFDCHLQPRKMEINGFTILNI